MCKKLLFLVAMLSIVSVASAVAPNPLGTVTVIDDFESYWGTPAMVPVPWDGQVLPGTVNVLSLVTAGGSAQGAQHMQWVWTNNGGWALPNDPTTYDPQSDHVEMGMTMPAYNINSIAAGDLTTTLMHMSLQMPVGAGAPPGEYLLEYSGTGLPDPCTGDPSRSSQTWIPAPGSGAAWWIPAETIPAKIGPDSEWEWGGHDYSGVPSLEPNGVWLDITVNPVMWVTWGCPLAEFDDLTGLNFASFGNGPGDTSGASGDPKMNGTAQVWPPGPISGTLLIDNIWFEEVPEPMTIALLGLGGLALIRRKR